MPTLFLLMSLCSTPLPATGPDFGDLIVVVFDTTPCHPVVGADLSLDASSSSVRTGAHGSARFESVAPGTHRVIATVAGCEVSALVEKNATSPAVAAIDMRACRRRVPLASSSNTRTVRPGASR